MRNTIILIQRAHDHECVPTKEFVSLLKINRHKRFRPPDISRRMCVWHVKDGTGECQHLHKMTTVFDLCRTNRKIIWCTKADCCKHVYAIDCKIVCRGDMTARVYLEML